MDEEPAAANTARRMARPSGASSERWTFCGQSDELRRDPVSAVRFAKRREGNGGEPRSGIEGDRSSAR
jgi:hypothetical protein